VQSVGSLRAKVLCSAARVGSTSTVCFVAGSTQVAAGSACVLSPIASTTGMETCRSLSLASVGVSQKASREFLIQVLSIHRMKRVPTFTVAWQNFEVLSSLYVRCVVSIVSHHTLACGPVCFQGGGGLEKDQLPRAPGAASAAECGLSASADSAMRTAIQLPLPPIDKRSDSSLRTIGVG